MRLNKLEIQGFKSFAEKISIEFKKGITSVVGPNGSGKSNVTDAVRWVLGEQNAKNLRGGKMEDVIFSGTQTRKPLGFAEVSLVLDNQAGELPLEYTEVKITRKIYRSGESEYSINNHSCRLRDIHELFMDTGIGKEGYSIIGQGKIDEILSTKSEDRRNLFEEAAGIIKYKTRKNEAEKRLKQERENLVRVNDIISELESQLEPLYNQAEQAKKYLRLKYELKEFEINYFIHQSTEMKNLLSQFEESIHDLQNQLNFHSHKKEISTKEYHEFKNKQTLLETSYQKTQNDIFELKTSIEKQENEIRLSEEKIHHIDRDLLRLQKEKENTQVKHKKIKEQQDLLEAKFNGVQLQLNGKNHSLQDAEQQFEKMSTVILQNESQIETLKGDIIERLNNISEIKSQVQRMQVNHDDIEKRKLSIQEEIKNLVESEKMHQYKQDQLHQEIDQFHLNIKNLSQEITKLQTNKMKMQEALVQYSKDDQKLQAQYNTKLSRKKLLSEMENDFEGYQKSVKTILSHQKEGHPVFKGVYGSVGELIKVPAGFETALEVALGGSLQNIITENEQIAKNVIDFMKKNQLGRATFLPITTIRSKNLNTEKRNILSITGVQGVASEIVQYEQKYKNIIENLLGRVVIVDHIDIGIALARQFNHGFKIVTLEGDVIHAGGSMTGGSVQNKSSNIFGRKREIEDLTLEIVKIKEKNTEAQKNISEMEKELSELEKHLEASKHLYHNQKLSAQQIESDLKVSLKESSGIENKINHLEFEGKQLIIQGQKVQQELTHKENEQKSMQSQIEDIQKQIDVLQQAYSSDKRNKEEFLQHITNYKVEISSLKQEKNYIEESILRLNEELKALKDRELEILDEVSSLNKDKEDLQKQIERLKRNIVIGLEEVKNSQDEIIKISNCKKEISLKIIDFENEIEKINGNIATVQEQIYSIGNKKNKIETEEQALFTKMWDEYEITFSSAQEFKKDLGNLQQIQKKILELKNDFKNLGNVNVGAIEDYKNVKERYDFLTQQRDDILNAELSLTGMIEEMTVLMRNQFSEQFELIAGSFDNVFQELFGGGKAELRLTDPKDVLQSGIEINVQPPGKKLQTLTLLSGGERALTAIAILFAILKVKPSPFCILDEIEAALDDANVTRYAQYLKNFSKDTQFIVVTHRKGTMEIADALYGITMQEHGISKLLSVEFNEATG